MFLFIVALHVQLGEKDFVAFVGGPNFAHTLLVSQLSVTFDYVRMCFMHVFYYYTIIHNVCIRNVTIILDTYICINFSLDTN